MVPNINVTVVLLCTRRSQKCEVFQPEFSVHLLFYMYLAYLITLEYKPESAVHRLPNICSFRIDRLLDFIHQIVLQKEGKVLGPGTVLFLK